MVQLLAVAEPKHGTGRSKSLVGRAVDEAGDTRVYQSSRAHRARLYRRVNGRSGQPVITDPHSRGTQCKDLRMPGRVVISYRPVRSGSEYLLIRADNDS